MVSDHQVMLKKSNKNLFHRKQCAWVRWEHIRWCQVNLGQLQIIMDYAWKSGLLLQQYATKSADYATENKMHKTCISTPRNIFQSVQKLLYILFCYSWKTTGNKMICLKKCLCPYWYLCAVIISQNIKS